MYIKSLPVSAVCSGLKQTTTNKNFCFSYKDSDNYKCNSPSQFVSQISSYIGVSEWDRSARVS